MPGDASALTFLQHPFAKINEKRPKTGQTASRSVALKGNQRKTCILGGPSKKPTEMSFRPFAVAGFSFPVPDFRTCLSDIDASPQPGVSFRGPPKMASGCLLVSRQKPRPKGVTSKRGHTPIALADQPYSPLQYFGHLYIPRMSHGQNYERFPRRTRDILRRNFEPATHVPPK